MKNTMKKALCAVLVVVMLITGMPMVYSSAATGISIGDEITLGTYNGEPITWICVDIDDNGPLMLSEDVLCVKEYDAPGTSSTYHTDGWGYIRKNYGSNCWYDSNIRQWLNSFGNVEYTHCPPSYSAESGFLSNFSTNELGCIKTANHIVNVNVWENNRYGYCDGGSSDTIPDLYEKTFNVKNYYYKYVEDKMFLLSASQFNRIYISNKEFLNASRDYLTCIIDGNNSSCFENVCPIDIKTLQVVSYAFRAYEKTGIRPSFYLDVDEYEDIVNNGEKFPSGYNFYEDSYGFSNNKSANISKKYYTTLFESGTADLIYKETHNASALCYGFAYTTAAIYGGFPDVSRFSYLDGLEPKIATKIRDLDRETWLCMGSAVIVDGKYDNCLTLSDYIKYAYIYQYSQEALNLLNNSADDALGLLRIVKDMTNDGFMGVAVGFTKRSNAPSSAPGGHEVLAVGYKGDNTILIDNPNNTENWEELTVNSDGSWSFGSYNSRHHILDYALNIYRPYQLLLTGEKVTPWNSIVNKNDSVSKDEYYVVGMDKLDSEYSLIRINSDSFELSSNDYIEVPSNSKSGVEEETIKNRLFWIKDTNSIVISNLNDDTIIDYAGDNTILTANVTKDSTVTMTIDDSNINTQIETQKGDEYTVSVETITTDEEYNDVEILAQVSGTASGSEITATQTETGLLVTGISDGTVTLTKDDEVIETQEIKNAVGEIEITYDKTGEDEDVELEYHSHSYTSSITTPATHTAEGIETFTCSCGDSYTKPVAKLEGHTHTVTNTVAPTCTADGLTVYTCACGDSYSETVKAKGHSYGEDGICVNCDDYNKAYDKTANDSENCSHLCHKGGFMGFIWKIVQIFIRLFKTNPVCECGAAHY